MRGANLVEFGYSTAITFSVHLVVALWHFIRRSVLRFGKCTAIVYKLTVVHCMEH